MMKYNFKNFPFIMNQKARDHYNKMVAELREIGDKRILNQQCKEDLQDLIKELLGEQ